MSIGGRHGARMLDLTLARAIAREKFSQASHAIRFRSRSQQHLAEIEIGHYLRQLKAELRIAELGLVQRLVFLERTQVIIRIEDTLADFREGLGRRPRRRNIPPRRANTVSRHSAG